jgi:beta-catenin-like protein 1
LLHSQLIDVLLAWLVAEDDGARQKIISLLADRDEDLSIIKATLKGKQHSLERIPSFVLTAFQSEQMEGLADDEPGQKDHKEMLGTLLQFL